MTTIRKIVTSQVDGNDANIDNDVEIRPFGEAGFYIDTDGNTDKLVLSMFEGQRTHLRSKVLSPGVLYGSNADSGDEAGFDTIKLIPDASLHYNDGSFGNDQYLVVDPTGPNHIHIRAGGTIDNSSADLYIGGEQTHVRVSDGSENVVITTSDTSGESPLTNEWVFSPDGTTYLPHNTASPLSYLNSPINDETIKLSLGGGDGVQIVADEFSGSEKIWSFDKDGGLTFPGDQVALFVDGMAGPTDFNISIPEPITGSAVFRFTTEGGDGELIFPDGTHNNGGTVATAPDNDIVLQTGYRPTIVATAGEGSGLGQIIVDITENDDITVVDSGWEVNINTDEDPIWSAVATATNNGDTYTIEVSGFTFNESTDYTFRQVDASEKVWRFRAPGPLVAPGGAILSSETADLGLDGTYRDFAIELPSQDGENEYRWEFDNSGDMIAPGAITIAGSLNTPLGSVVSIGIDADTFVGLQGDTGSGVIIRATDDELNFIDWTFDVNGGFTTPYGLQISDQYIQHPETSNFISLNNDTGVDIVCSGEMRLGTNFSDSINRKFWRLNPNGTVTFPDNTTQTTAWAGGRVVGVPGSSAGASGDKAGDIAFDGTYMYYCAHDYGSAPSETFTVSNVGAFSNVIDVNKASNPNYTVPQAGWTTTVGTLMTLTAFSGDNINGVDYSFLFDVPSNDPLPSTVTLTSPTPYTNIWKRVAWSGDTW